MAEKHILAVDDDPTMRELIADYLTNHGFRVSTAADGREAWTASSTRTSSTWSSWI